MIRSVPRPTAPRSRSGREPIARRPLRRAATVGAALLACTTGTAVAAPGADFYKGVALGHHTNISPKLLDQSLSELKELGATHVSVVVSWSMVDVRASQIKPRKDYTTPDRVLVWMIRRAKAQGLGVMLFPILDVQRRKPLEWRGTIKPKRWEDWWRNYRRFALHYARIAAAGGADVLCVGSELVSTESQRPRWADLIAQIRKTYDGLLLYSANWDHYKPVTFWELVDLVGVTGYYGLAKEPNAGVDEMVASWERVRDQLASWARKTKRRFVFTEVGYPSLDGGAVNPWDYTQGTAPDVEEQQRAYSAFTRAWSGVKELQGVFFWDWYGPGGLRDTRYTPRGKPAATVIKRWFRRPRP